LGGFGEDNMGDRMYLFADVPGLGELHVFEELMFYDGAEVFLCCDFGGGIYLGVWTGQSDLRDDWLLSPISVERVRACKDGVISVREALCGSLEVFRLVCGKDTGVWGVERVLVKDLVDGELPAAGLRFGV
jgi:hypothetical protein